MGRPESDTNPANNVSAELPLSVGGERTPYDIGVRLVSVSATTLAIGSSFDVNYEALNPNGVHGSYRRTIVLSPDPAITLDDVAVNTRNLLLRGSDAQPASRNNVVPASIAPGSYFAGLILEPDRDTNMSDNFSAGIAVTVTPAAGLTRDAQHMAPRTEGATEAAEDAAEGFEPAK